jgi:hypothetical protein
MNTLERLNKISAKAQQIADDENNEQLKKLETIEYYKNAIKSLSPRLTELIKIGDALIENGISFGKRTKDIIGYDEEFITNGITHKLGFYFEYGKFIDFIPSAENTELRIYQSDEIIVHHPESSVILDISDKIVTFSQLLEKVSKEE